MSRKNKCAHLTVRCVHGDEINHTMKGFIKIRFARVKCLRCGAYLYNRRMPRFCFYSGSEHNQ